MGFISWIVVGAIAGWLAGKVMKGKGFGLVGDIVVGVIGALVGGWVAGSIFHVPDPVNGINLSTLLVAFLGSIIVLYIGKMIKK